MPIIFNPNNNLKPPILNGIEEINNALGALNLNAFNVAQITSPNIVLNSDTTFTNNGLLQTANAGQIVFNVDDFFEINYILKIFPKTTVEILAITPIIGMQVFNSNLNQMFFYQVSPITGTILGWYNSTGSIKL